MAPQEIQGNIQIRTAVLIFCVDMAQPLVLYFNNAQAIYEQVKKLINLPEAKMLEFEPLGPIKKVAIQSNRIVSVAIQEERYIIQEHP